MQRIKVRVDEKMGAERSIKKFKRMCDTFGIIKEYRSRVEYKKPSVKAKEKSEAAEKRRRKTEMKGRRFSKL